MVYKFDAQQTIANIWRIAYNYKNQQKIHRNQIIPEILKFHKNAKNPLKIPQFHQNSKIPREFSKTSSKIPQFQQKYKSTKFQSAEVHTKLKHSTKFRNSHKIQISTEIRPTFHKNPPNFQQNSTKIPYTLHLQGLKHWHQYGSINMYGSIHMCGSRHMYGSIQMCGSRHMYGSIQMCGSTHVC